MSEILRSEAEIGFLPHEIHFVYGALRRASRALKDANKEYGEAVASSGGDWAFDDPGSQVAAMEAHQREKDLLLILRLSNYIKDNGEIPYPSIDKKETTYGSRVYTLESDGYNGIFDLATHHIPGIPADDEVIVITPEAPIAKHLHGVKVGESITWQAPSGIELEATITNIDQTAMREFYNNIGGTHDK